MGIPIFEASKTVSAAPISIVNPLECELQLRYKQELCWQFLQIVGNSLCENGLDILLPHTGNQHVYSTKAVFPQSLSNIYHTEACFK
jgi:hypothetical protein